MHSTKAKKKVSPRSKFPLILCVCALFLGFLCFFSGRWYVTSFGRLGFDSVLYTLTGGLGGVQSGQVSGYLLNGLLPSVLLTALTAWFLIRQPLARKGTYSSPNPSRKFACWCCILLALALTVTASDGNISSE